MGEVERVEGGVPVGDAEKVGVPDPVQVTLAVFDPEAVTVLVGVGSAVGERDELKERLGEVVTVAGGVTVVEAVTVAVPVPEPVTEEVAVLSGVGLTVSVGFAVMEGVQEVV